MRRREKTKEEIIRELKLELTVERTARNEAGRLNNDYRIRLENSEAKLKEKINKLKIANSRLNEWRAEIEGLQEKAEYLEKQWETERKIRKLIDKENSEKDKDLKKQKDKTKKIKEELEKKEKEAKNTEALKETYKIRTTDLELEREELNKQFENSQKKCQKLVRGGGKANTHSRNIWKTKQKLINQLNFSQEEYTDLEQAGLGLLDAYFSKEQELRELEEICLRLRKACFQKEEEIFSLNEIINSKVSCINNLNGLFWAVTSEKEDLQTWKDNHNCSCPLSHETCSHSDYEELKTKCDELQTWKDNHDCSPSPACSLPLHSDYDQIKQEKDELKKQLDNYPDYQQIKTELATVKNNLCSDGYHQTIEQQKEQDIITLFNNRLKLNLLEPDLEKLLTVLIKLINKPPVEIEKKIIEQLIGAPIHTQDLREIKKLNLHSLTKNLKINCSQQMEQQIKKAGNYQTIIQVKERLVKAKLTEQQQDNRTIQNQIKNWQIIWLISFLSATLIIVSLLIKIKIIGRPKKVGKLMAK